MSILADYEIRELCMGDKPMLSPYYPEIVKHDNQGKGILSFGSSSYGYDVRIAPEFRIFNNINSVVVDPKNLDERSLVTFEGDVCIVPPNSYVLGRTLEYIRLPRDVTALCLSKSTYARAGLVISATVLEAGWEGELVLEIANTTNLPVKLYANEGVAQLLFYRGNPCDVSYADRKGKYFGQRGLTLPKV